MNIYIEDFAAIPIERLTTYTCRWPLWSDDSRRPPSTEEARYCGRPPLPELPYCKHHMNIARKFPKKDD